MGYIQSNCFRVEIKGQFKKKKKTVTRETER